MAFYLAGVDIAADDRYGRMSLTDAGIRERDGRVIAALRDLGIPVAIVLGGGYAATPERTAELHAHAFSLKFFPGVNGILRQIKRLSHISLSSEWLHGDRLE
jgi:acetoin utilization deacetylase AcuC-like enzyme